MKRTIIFSIILLTLTTFGYTAPTMTMTTSKSGEASLLLAGTGSCTIDWGDGSAVETHALQALTEQGWAEDEHTFRHRYSRGGGNRTISITGENITHFSCYSMEATDLDVSQNTTLTELICYRNKITELNLGNLVALTRFYCNINQIAVLNIDNLTALEYLDCSENQLKNLDISKNAKLERVICDENKLTAFDASNNPELKNVSFVSNQCTSAALDALLKTLNGNAGYKVIHIRKNPGSEGCNDNIAKDKGWTVWK